MVWVFWLSFVVLVYIYAGYPALLWCTRPRNVNDVRRDELPTWDVVMASHHEGPRLLEKIREVFTQDGSETLQRILVGIDGPDESFQKVERDFLAEDFPVVVLDEGIGFPSEMELPDRGCFLVKFQKRRGKPACLNRLSAWAQSDVMVFFDARQRIGEQCVSSLLHRFADPSIHVVSGNLEWEKSEGVSTTGQGVGVYWAYEKWIRRQEALRGSVPGATGACYALRREYFDPIPEDTLVDDVLIPLQACREKGCCIFEPTAKIYDVVSTTSKQEALRKRRTIAGIYQLLFRHPQWVLPGGHPFWFSILSHKILRLAGPFLLLLLLLSNLMLLDGRVYRLGLFAQGALYTGAFFAPALRSLPVVGKLCSGAHSFVLLNWTCLVALVDCLTGRFAKGWDRAYVGDSA